MRRHPRRQERQPLPGPGAGPPGCAPAIRRRRQGRGRRPHAPARPRELLPSASVFRLAIGHFRYFLLSPVPDTAVSPLVAYRVTFCHGIRFYRAARVAILRKTTSVGDELDLTP